MKGYNLLFITFIVLLINTLACKNRITEKTETANIRPLKDTVGFAQYSWQMDSLMNRIEQEGWKKGRGSSWRLAVCPHDDYTYAGRLYPDLLQNIKASNLILIGVAHKAAKFGIEDNLVFDSFAYWKGPWKPVPVSPVRDELYKLLAGRFAVVNDSLHISEHSVEALIPFLQYFNRNITIVPILVPSMTPNRMKECGRELAEAIRTVSKNHRWEWGTDYAIVVTTDAVHYGNEDWGGKDMAYYGCDDSGNKKALEHEHEIIDSCLINNVTPHKIRLFSSYTINESDYKEYKWTWCGRYSVPVALWTSYYLNDSLPMKGNLVGYSTSITSLHINVDDIGMGHTAIATRCHWVGYAALGYH